MKSPVKCFTALQVSLALTLLISLTFFASSSGKSTELKSKKSGLGSRPPRCVNKCLNCRPCLAALVVAPHPKGSLEISTMRDESYYLLSWKCKCGNKFFQP